jgi:hypothetical protein
MVQRSMGERPGLEDSRATPSDTVVGALGHVPLRSYLRQTRLNQRVGQHQCPARGHLNRFGGRQRRALGGRHARLTQTKYAA